VLTVDTTQAIPEAPQRIAEEEALKSAREFAAVLAGSPAFATFLAVRERFAADETAQALWRRLQEAEQEMALLQTWGGAATAQLEELQRLRAEAQAHPAIGALFDAQDAVVTLFERTADVISAEGGLDFAGACRPAGGCCS
jgi:cell fate (sporulation/competence/biofilm development) regulator YlbF (YheA/YmcA/DUF963 family)